LWSGCRRCGNATGCSDCRLSPFSSPVNQQNLTNWRQGGQQILSEPRRHGDTEISLCLCASVVQMKLGAFLLRYGGIRPSTRGKFPVAFATRNHNHSSCFPRSVRRRLMASTRIQWRWKRTRDTVTR
jgi:hypothetical protein